VKYARLRSTVCFVVGLGLATSVALGETKVEPLPLEGQTFVHDPSTILKENGRYYLFGTGRGISTKSSPDLIHWTNGPSVFTDLPAWTTNAVPGYRGHTWAPDVLRADGQYRLYYSVSTFGKQVSAIGLTTSPTLDPASPDYCWTDRVRCLGLEYVGTQLLLVGRKYPFVHTLAETRELIAEIGIGNVGLVLDTWHWWTAGDTEAALHKAVRLIRP
jgi:hypothetical protein